MERYVGAENIDKTAAFILHWSIFVHSIIQPINCTWSSVDYTKLFQPSVDHKFKPIPITKPETK